MQYTSSILAYKKESIPIQPYNFTGLIHVIFDHLLNLGLFILFQICLFVAIVGTSLCETTSKKDKRELGLGLGRGGLGHIGSGGLGYSSDYGLGGLSVGSYLFTVIFYLHNYYCSQKA